MQHSRSVEHHQAEVASLVPRTAVVRLPLADCLGLALAEDITSPLALPPFDNSAMDGYAVRAADITSPPVVLPVTEDIPAGRTDSLRLAPHTVHRIMTGAALPADADAVVPVERTDGGRCEVRIEASVPSGANRRAAGEDVAKDAQVLDAGMVLGPAQLGVAAAVGLSELPVYRPVRVLVLSTGSELVRPGETLLPGQIYESNGGMLAAAVRAAGGVAQQLHFVPDDVRELETAVAPHLDSVDLLLTSGGVSAGAYEVVKDAMAAQGVSFVRVAMQPGGPQGLGRYRGVTVAALPGNPVSSSVSFEIFVRPALRAAMGLPGRRPARTVTLATALESPAGRRQFRRGLLTDEGVTPVGGPGSHLLGALARSNCLIDIPAEVTKVAADTSVDVVPTDDQPS